MAGRHAAASVEDEPADPEAGQAVAVLSDQPAGRAEYWLAGSIVAISAVIFAGLAPFAKAQLPPSPAFIPIYQSALIVNDVITVAFLLGQRQAARNNALALLAGGYLFTALMATAHALSFPGLFSPTGLLGAGPQTTAWLYMFWHSGFPLFVMAYAGYGAIARTGRRGNTATISLGLVAVLAGGFVLLATRGTALLPAMMHGSTSTTANHIVVFSIWTINFLAFAILLLRWPYRVLDLWLIVTMCAWLFDIALSAGFNAGRFDLGFYAGRVYGLFAASFILIVLLIQNGRLYLQLIALRESDRQKTDELRRLSTVDPLTGIANRRAFEEALGLEWRRMMRHGTGLSLLMIDVDYFKRFNDRYGHPAGDECLRQVAKILAQRARRAGELAARYGGEEFAVLLPHTTLDAACKLADLLCAAVREAHIPHLGSEVASFVTISIGAACIAQVPEPGAGLSRDGGARPAAATVLIETADQALYAAKVAGRNRAVAAGDMAIGTTATGKEALQPKVVEVVDRRVASAHRARNGGV